ATYAQDVLPFDWLVGCWEQIDLDEGNTAIECWEKPDDVSLRGIGVMLENNDTVFIERLRIYYDNDTAYYAADVDHNEAEVDFRISPPYDSGFMSINEHHDFPNKICYKQKGVDSLEVFIANMDESKKRYFSFVKKNN
ncbi:DUF6265 family protein, partial [Fulvivirga aurantia]|uniref:DUF6265 family protein n=1 Tax=Fulvivirga aurantia TaxID=2529383 RepID=UPI0016251152